MPDPQMLDIFWILLASSLVFIMQAGFMCLESGLTRSKNSINVAIKNMTDFCLSFFVFWAFGFGLMFGMTQTGWIGGNNFLIDFGLDPWRSAFFFFQAMFCATAATILSGAVAERVHYLGYIYITFLISGLVYPIYGHWAWNGLDGATSGGWLANMGFVDFAGSTVVHSVGGWAGLAALLIVGPRQGRFPEQGEPRKINASNLPLSVLGGLLLFLGWFGFNGGSTLVLDQTISGIIANTALAGVVGGLTALAVGTGLRGRPDADLVVNGVLAGLVAITANCHAVSSAESVVIGAVGALFMLGTEHILERFRIDDAVGAVPVHLGAGIWGTLAVAMFGDSEILGTGLTYWAQWRVQVVGVVSAGVWTFATVWVLLWILNRITPLRVTAEQEEMGLNVAEHGASTELIDLLSAMTKQGRAGDLSIRVPVEPFTEVGQIARRYNAVMDMLQRAVARAELIVRDIQDGIITFSQAGRLTSFNPGAENIFGYRGSEVIDQPMLMLFAGGDMSASGVARVMQSGGGEVRARRRDNSEFYAEMRVSRSEMDGEVVYTGLVKDITERRAAEEALQANRDMVQRHNQALAQLAQDLPGGEGSVQLQQVAELAAQSLDVPRVSVWSLDANDSLLCRNSIHGKVSSDDLGRALQIELDQVPPFRDALARHVTLDIEDAVHDTRTRGLWADYLSRNDIKALLIVHVNLGGELRGVLAFEQTGHTRAWLPEETLFAGSVANYISLSFEELQRRRAESEVREINRELENRVVRRTQELEESYRELRDAMAALQDTQKHLVQSEKMAALGELVAGVAHEINTPVGVSVTAASHFEQKTRDIVKKLDEGTMKRSDLDDFLQLSSESAEMLLANLSRASELVQSFKKVAVDQSSEARRTFNLKAYIDEILLSLRPKLKRLRHEIVVDCPDDLTLESFPGAYSQVITNLIMNSLVHAYEEDEQGKIAMTFEVAEGTLYFRYADDGKGIPSQNLPRIFDPFFTTRRGSGGSGLGLNLLFNIVTTTLGGRIECESTVGEGTTFHIRLPLVTAEKHPDE